jgi:hypothetical protein
MFETQRRPARLNGRLALATAISGFPYGTYFAKDADDAAVVTSPEVQELDPLALVVGEKPAEKPAETPPKKPAETAQTAQTEAETPAAETSTPAETSADAHPPVHQPGTPDKALQAMQQDLAATQRKLDVLLEKTAAGEALTAREQAAAVAGKRKLDELREKLAERSGAVLDHEGLLVETLAEIDTTVKTLADENKQLRQTMQAMQQQTAEQQQAAAWSAVEKQYPGVQHRDVWTKAAEDAAATLGEDAPPQTVHRLASRWFHERCDAAVKSLAARKPAAPPPPPAPRGTTQVRTAETPPPPRELSDDDKYLAAADALVVKG